MNHAPNETKHFNIFAHDMSICFGGNRDGVVGQTEPTATLTWLRNLLRPTGQIDTSRAQFLVRISDARDRRILLPVFP